MRKVIFSLWIALLLVGSLNLAVAQEGNNNGVEFKGDADPDKLKAILELSTGLIWNTTAQTTIWVGLLPDNLTFELPLPEGAELIGAVQTEDLGWSNTQLYLSTEATPEALRQFFVETLTGDQWKVAPTYSGGFIPQAFTNLQICYDNGDQSTVLDLSSRALPDRTVALVNLTKQFCPDYSQIYNNDPYQFMPSLVAPEGVTQQPNYSGGGGGGGGKGGRAASSAAFLTSELPVGEIAAGYNAQLTEAGWVNVTDEALTAIAASTWTFTAPDETTWSGYLTLTADPANPNQYYATLNLQEHPAAE